MSTSPIPAGDQLASLIEAQLTSRGYRQTVQRRTILRALSRCAGRFSIDQLLNEARTESPRTGYATVHRMLRLLVHCQLACARHCTDGMTRYELTLGIRPPHDFLVCDDCGLAISFRDDAVQILQERVASSHGFRLETRVLELNGTCATCAYGESRSRASIA